MFTKIEPMMLSINEAAQLLGVKRGLIYQMVIEGKIPSVKIGIKVYRISRRWILDQVAKAEGK